MGFLERFWARVDTSGGPAACWPWRGWVNDHGYGIVACGPQRRAIHIRAHRLAYELTHREPIPAALTIDHLCRVRHCVNPAHLDVVTKGVSVRRGATTAARHAETMVCPYGHAYDAANTAWKADGSRGCRACNRRRCREYQARRRIDGRGGRPLHGPPRGSAMRWLLGMVLAVAVAAPAAAATWTCAERTEIITTTLVMVRCTATGTYTTGGDPLSNPNVDLCNSENRIPQAAVSSTAASATTGQGYVAAMDRATHRLVLLTAAPTPGPQNALLEVAGGTAIDGATFMALVNCK